MNALTLVALSRLQVNPFGSLILPPLAVMYTPMVLIKTSVGPAVAAPVLGLPRFKNLYDVFRIWLAALGPGFSSHGGSNSSAHLVLFSRFRASLNPSEKGPQYCCGVPKGRLSGRWACSPEVSIKLSGLFST